MQQYCPKVHKVLQLTHTLNMPVRKWNFFTSSSWSYPYSSYPFCIIINMSSYPYMFSCSPLALQLAPNYGVDYSINYPSHQHKWPQGNRWVAGYCENLFIHHNQHAVPGYSKHVQAACNDGNLEFVKCQTPSTVSAIKSVPWLITKL